MIQVKKLSWEDVVNGGNFLGGRIETVKDDKLRIGSVARIEIREGRVLLTFMPIAGIKGDWMMVFANFDSKVELQDVGEGKIQFLTRSLGVCTISPKKS